MSNTAVGPVYDAVIQEVISAVRVDFEENGVDEGVLDDLKKKWQLKLSQMNVAQFPWDPKPEPQPASAATNGPSTAAAAAAAAAASNYTQASLSPNASAHMLSLPGPLHPNPNGIAMTQDPGLARAEPMIKQEPGVASSGIPHLQSTYSPANAARGTAAQRAAQALESQYGQRAAASINAIHSGMASQMNAGAQAQLAQRPGQAPQPLNPQQQCRQGVAAASIQQRMPQAPHAGAPNGLPSSQVDGPSGAPVQGPVVMDRAKIDWHLHARIAARAKQMEGGGVMLPHKEATSQPAVSTESQDVGVPAPFDGPGDDTKSELSDEDAINSDLDDSDDDKDDDEDDDESGGHMMLCMYDKVQRVKNKWKCILKDGVLTVNGKEYVFHKATGEYEW